MNWFRSLLDRFASKDETDLGFICAQCGATHDGIATDIGFKLPDVVWEIPSAERESRARFTEDVCIFGERCFVRCVLSIPILGGDDSFGWGVWVEVDVETFQAYVMAWEGDVADAPPRSGILANRLSDYDDFVDERVTMIFGGAGQRPTLWLSPQSETSLAREQRSGMSQSRWHDIAAPLRWWWLSFVDPKKPDGKRFLGVCIVEARGSKAAQHEARRRGIHPGDDVHASKVSETDLPEESLRNRLLSKRQLTDAGMI